jgi:hypothetical protein
MATRKTSRYEDTDRLIAQLAQAGGGSALISAIRKALRSEGSKTGAANTLRNFQRILEIVAQFGFRFSGTFATELRFKKIDFADHSILLAPRSDGKVGWSHFSPSGTTYGMELTSLRKFLCERYGKGIIYCGRRRVIVAGPSTAK